MSRRILSRKKSVGTKIRLRESPIPNSTPHLQENFELSKQALPVKLLIILVPFD